MNNGEWRMENTEERNTEEAQKPCSGDTIDCLYACTTLIQRVCSLVKG